MQEKLDLAKVLEWLTLAGAGGAVRFVGDRMQKNDSISHSRYAILLLGNGFISGFSGLLGALLISRVTPDHVYQLIAAGVFGYFGTQGIERIGNYVLTRFKV